MKAHLKDELCKVEVGHEITDTVADCIQIAVILVALLVENLMVHLISEVKAQSKDEFKTWSFSTGTERWHLDLQRNCILCLNIGLLPRFVEVKAPFER